MRQKQSLVFGSLFVSFSYFRFLLVEKTRSPSRDCFWRRNVSYHVKKKVEMENLFNEQTLRIIDKKFFSFLNYITPGFFVLELFFKKGLFSKIPQSIYEFLIYAFWCFLLSIPFAFFENFSLESLSERMKNDSLKDKTIDKEKFLKDSKKSFKKHKKKNEKIDSMLEFLYIAIYLIITFIIYKFLTSYYSYYSVLKIDKQVLIFINTLLILYVIYFIAIRPMTVLIEKRIVSRRHDS